MKILHFADIHARDKDIDEVSRCLGFIVGQSQTEKPDLIVFAGDAFHARDVRLDSQAAKLVIETFADLSDIAPVVAVLGTPSHDGRAPEILSMVRGKYEIYVATQPSQICMINGGMMPTSQLGEYARPDAVITLIPQPTKEFWGKKGGIQQTDQEIAQAMGQIFAGFGGMASQYLTLHILVGHFTVGGAVTSTGQVMIGREIEVSREQVGMANADLVCLGHIHKSQWIEPNIYYAGSIYRENWGEQEDKGFLIHEFDNSGIHDFHFIKTPTKKIARVEIDMTANGFDQITSLSGCNFFVDKASVRIEIKAWQDEAQTIDRKAIEDQFILAGASEIDIRIIRVPRETVRSANILKLSTLRDKITELATTRGEQVPAQILEKADMLESVPAEKIMEQVGGAA